MTQKLQNLLPSLWAISLSLLLWSTITSTSSFSVPSRTLPQFPSKFQATPRRRSFLFYRNGDQDGTSQKRSTARANRMSLPVLGPLMTQRSPLLPGQEFVLNDPTPMQWQTLDQCLLQHTAHIQNATSAAGVSAAPLLALLDEYTSSSSFNRRVDPSSSVTTPRGRYATIVAIVGLSKNQPLQHDANSDPSGLINRRSSTSNGEFMERLQNRQSTSMRVRFLGVGRAVLTDFFYQSTKQDCLDEEGNMLDVPECNLLDNDDDDDDVSSRHDQDTTDNIIMARFRILTDDGVRRIRPSGANSKTDPAVHSSPVHAIAKYSQLTFQIQRLHSERQQLVAGIHAAQARLQAAAATATRNVPVKVDADDDWEDHDGFGLLYASKEQQHMAELVDQQPVIDQILRDFPGAATGTPAATFSTTVPSSRANYGLGATVAAVSTIAALLLSRLEQLQPYYSPSQHTSEEHYYELYSFAALQALQDSYESPDEAAQATAVAVVGRHTADRLQSVCDQMTRHVQWLREHASILSQDLRDCGEECTDLW